MRIACRNSVIAYASVPGLLLRGHHCASGRCSSRVADLAAVGPPPLLAQLSGSNDRYGQLQVFTETDEYEYDQDVPFFPHRNYQIYTADGKRLKRVWNSQNHEDEIPALVNLPVGNYLIGADAEFCGEVLIPVVIRPNALTPVMLQPGWKPPRGGFSQSDLVQCPAGYSIGWKAGVTNP